MYAKVHSNQNPLRVSRLTKYSQRLLSDFKQKRITFGDAIDLRNAVIIYLRSFEWSHLHRMGRAVVIINSKMYLPKKTVSPLAYDLLYVVDC